MIELSETNDGWHLSFSDCQVQLILIDFRLGLCTTSAPDKVRLDIGGQCRLRDPDVDVLLDPENTVSLAPVLSLFQAQMLAIDIRKTGHLAVSFDGGRTLEVEPRTKFEAWELGCSEGSVDTRFICRPSGGVTQY